jgi:hypothetical protein
MPKTLRRFAVTTPIIDLATIDVLKWYAEGLTKAKQGDTWTWAANAGRCEFRFTTRETQEQFARLLWTVEHLRAQVSEDTAA